MDRDDTVLSEDQEQMLVVQWMRRAHPKVRIFAIPSGGHRHIAVAAKLKATGVVRGAPDLFIPEWRLWIEMKRVKGGRLSVEQQDWIEYLTSIGYHCIVGYGFDDAVSKIISFLTEKC